MKGPRKYYNFRDIVPVQFNITHSLPVKIHVELDTFSWGLVNVHVGEAQRDMTEINLHEMDARERPRECRGQDGINNILNNLSNSDIDIGP